MFCKECGKKMPEDSKFCPECGTNNSTVFKIVSYIGILWILGLFCGSKNDSKVRFHVGQGIILTIACVAAGIVAGIINLIIVATCVEASFFGITTGVNTLGKVLLAIVNLAYYGACIFYIVTGIVHIKGEFYGRFNNWSTC